LLKPGQTPALQRLDSVVVRCDRKHGCAPEADNLNIFARRNACNERSAAINHVVRRIGVACCRGSPGETMQAAMTNAIPAH